MALVGWSCDPLVCYDTMPCSRITRTILTLTAMVQGEVRPSDMTSNRCSALKNTLRRDRVVSCACELLLFSAVFYTVRAAAQACVFSLIINRTPKRGDKWEVTGSYRVTCLHFEPYIPCGFSDVQYLHIHSSRLARG